MEDPQQTQTPVEVPSEGPSPPEAAPATASAADNQNRTSGQSSAPELKQSRHCNIFNTIKCIERFQILDDLVSHAN